MTLLSCPLSYFCFCSTYHEINKINNASWLRAQKRTMLDVFVRYQNSWTCLLISHVAMWKLVLWLQSRTHLHWFDHISFFIHCIFTGRYVYIAIITLQPQYTPLKCGVIIESRQNDIWEGAFLYVSCAKTHDCSSYVGQWYTFLKKKSSNEYQYFSTDTTAKIPSCAAARFFSSPHSLIHNQVKAQISVPLPSVILITDS